jgi:hypothetical protein
MMASVAIAAIKSGVLHRWYGWLALILALLKSLDPLHLALASPKTGTPAFLATILWLLLTGALLLGTRGSSESSTAAG